MPGIPPPAVPNLVGAVPNLPVRLAPRKVSAAMSGRLDHYRWVSTYGKESGLLVLCTLCVYR